MAGLGTARQGLDTYTVVENRIMKHMTKDKDTVTQTIVNVPEWRRIYEALLVNADIGDVITYVQLDETLGRPFKRSRSPLYRACRELGDLRHRWLEVEKSVGYRVVHPREHVRLTKVQQKAARHHIGKGLTIVTGTDLALLNPDELTAHDAQAKVLAFLFSVQMHDHTRINRIEAILDRAGLT